jgi:hypothetical protein
MSYIAVSNIPNVKKPQTLGDYIESQIVFIDNIDYINDWAGTVNDHIDASSPHSGHALVSRAINTDGATLTGGGNLSTDRTLSILNGGVTDAKIGNRTIDDTTAPATNVGILATLLGYIANRIKAITGKDSWQTSPSVTLEDASNHINSYMKHAGYGVTTGVANTYALTLNPAATSYVDGMIISAKINVNSTGASTINVDGLGAKSIYDSLNTAVTNLKQNIIYTMRYEATSGNFIVQGGNFIVQGIGYGIQSDANGIAVKIDGTTLTKSANGLKVSDNTYAPINHNHAGVYEPADTNIMKKNSVQSMGAQLTAQNNTNYTTAQVRNITLSTGTPSGGGNGDIWFRYIP